MELKVKNAVADSGAQITIVPASLLDQRGTAITGLRQSKVDLRAANNARIDVQGVADAMISALSPTGEHFRTSTKVYVVRNVEEVYLSLDVLVGLRIVNEHFPAAGAGNQHGAQQGAWDKTGTVTEQLPHASYSVQVDGSGRILQRTRQHLQQFIPHDSRATQHASRNSDAHRSPRCHSESPADGRQHRTATPLASQVSRPRSQQQRGDEDEDEDEDEEQAGSRTPATAHQERQEDLFHDFGDRGIYYRNNVHDNNNDVSDNTVTEQNLGDNFNEEDAGEPEGNSAADAGARHGEHAVRIELFPKVERRSRRCSSNGTRKHVVHRHITGSSNEKKSRKLPSRNETHEHVINRHITGSSFEKKSRKLPGRNEMSKYLLRRPFTGSSIEKKSCKLPGRNETSKANTRRANTRQANTHRGPRQHLRGDQAKEVYPAPPKVVYTHSIH